MHTNISKMLANFGLQSDEFINCQLEQNDDGWEIKMAYDQQVACDPLHYVHAIVCTYSAFWHQHFKTANQMFRHVVRRCLAIHQARDEWQQTKSSAIFRYERPRRN